MSKKITNRRKTVGHEPTERGEYNQRISDDQEDILIREILERWDLIESKKTDKSLTKTAITTRSTNAWEEILNAFRTETGVRLLSKILSTKCL